MLSHQEKTKNHEDFSSFFLFLLSLLVERELCTRMSMSIEVRLFFGFNVPQRSKVAFELCCYSDPINLNLLCSAMRQQFGSINVLESLPKVLQRRPQQVIAKKKSQSYFSEDLFHDKVLAKVVIHLVIFCQKSSRRKLF